MRATAQAREVERIRIDLIEVTDRHRKVTPEAVASLKQSVQEIGLQQPITVRVVDEANEDGEVVGNRLVLVAGAHRLTVAQELGWEKIEAFVVTWDEIDAELWEIDENFARSDLDRRPAAEAAMLKRRADLWKKREERDAKKSGGNSPTLTGRGNKQFAASLSDVTGQDKREINRKVARATVLGEDFLARVEGTSLDKGVELDALAKMPEASRLELVSRAEHGEKVSARAPVEQEIETVQEAAEARETAKDQRPRRLSIGALLESDAVLACDHLDMTVYLVGQYYGAGRNFLTKTGTNDMIEATLQEFLAAEPTVRDMAAMAQEAGRRAALKIFEDKWGSFVASRPTPPPKPPAKRRTKQATKQRRRA